MATAQFVLILRSLVRRPSVLMHILSAVKVCGFAFLLSHSLYYLTYFGDLRVNIFQDLTVAL